MKITTLRSMSDKCPDVYKCPSVHKVDGQPDRLYVVSKRVDDPATLSAFAHLVADDEILGWVDRELLPEV